MYSWEAIFDARVFGAWPVTTDSIMAMSERENNMKNAVSPSSAASAQWEQQHEKKTCLHHLRDKRAARDSDVGILSGLPLLARS